jgi:DNA-directed RNA polymerase specialized sigma24 family protein
MNHGWNEAYAALYSKCNPTLVCWLRKAFGLSIEQAEDVAATVHQSILNTPNGFDPQLPTAVSFLFQRARFTALDYLRKHSRKREEPIQPEHDNLCLRWPQSQQMAEDMIDFFTLLDQLKGRKQLEAMKKLIQAELEGNDTAYSMSRNERLRHAGLIFRARTTLRKLMGLTSADEPRLSKRSSLGDLLNGDGDEKAY